MNKKNLFSFDIDSTLINDKGIVLESTIKAIELIQSKNDFTVLNTGRSHMTTKNIANKLNISYSINLNGAAIFDIKNSKYIWKNYIDFKLIKDIFNYLSKRKVSIFVYSENKIYKWNRTDSYSTVDKLNKRFLDNSTYEELSYTLSSDDVLKKIRLNKDHFFKLIVQANTFSESLDEHSILNNLYGSKLNIYHGGENYPFIEIGVKENNKYNALLKFIEFSDYNKKNLRTISFGDGNNDYEMLSNSDVSVVMENASKSVKTLAKYITGENNEDSILKGVNWVYSFLNK